MRTLRVLAAVIAGYAIMVVLITLVQETWFGGVGYYESSKLELGVAGFFTCLSAFIGSAAGTVLAGGRGRVVANVMSLLVATETTLLLATRELDGPLWFDLLAAGGLVVGIQLGAEAIRRLPARVSGAPASP